MEFPGRLSLADEEALEATLRVEDEFLAIVADAGLIGKWPLQACRLTRRGDRFDMTIGDEGAQFEPSDPQRLGEWVDGRWPPSLAASVKALTHRAPPASSEAEPAGTAAAPWARVTVAQVGLIGVALVLLAIVVSAVLARDRPSPNLLTSIPTTTTVLATPTVFKGGVDEITFAWNEAADELRLDLFLVETPGPNRLQMNLASGLVLYATEDPRTGLVRTVMVAAGPTSGDRAGQAVLAAWGTLITMVNPELDGEGRRLLLAELGVVPERPLPHGIAEETFAGGARYVLRSGVLGERALLLVSPAA